MPAAGGQASPGIAVRVLSSISDVPAPTWNALLGPDDFYQSHEWLAVIERDNTATPRYLLAYLAGRPVGALPVYRISHEATATYHPDRLRNLLRVEGDHLVAGTRRCYRSELALAGRLPAAVRDQVAAALLARALELAVADGQRGIGCFYLPTATLRRIGRTSAVTAGFDGGEAVIEGVGAGLEAFLARCSSKLRAKIRREMRIFAATGWRTEVTPLAQCLSEVASLVSKVEQHHGHTTPDFLLERLLRRQAEQLADREVLLTCRDEHGDLVACALNYAWQNTLYSRAVGLEYDKVDGSYAYFNLMIYEGVRYASAHGLDRLHLGLASAAKAERGAVLSPLWTAAVQAGDGDERGVRMVDPAALSRWSAPYRCYAHALPEQAWELPAGKLPAGEMAADRAPDRAVERVAW